MASAAVAVRRGMHLKVFVFGAAGIEEAGNHKEGGFTNVPADTSDNAPTARDQHYDGVGTAPSCQSQDHHGDLPASCQRGKNSGSE